MLSYCYTMLKITSGRRDVLAVGRGLGLYGMGVVT